MILHVGPIFLSNYIPMTCRNVDVFIKSFLSDRAPSVSKLSLLLPLTLRLVSQKAVCSSLHFPHCFKQINFITVAIFASGLSLLAFRQLLQSAINSISFWATNNGFRFSTSKTFFFFSLVHAQAPNLHSFYMLLPSNSAFQAISLVSYLTPNCLGEIISFPLKKSPPLRLILTGSHICPGVHTANHSSISIFP